MNALISVLLERGEDSKLERAKLSLPSCLVGPAVCGQQSDNKIIQPVRDLSTQARIVRLVDEEVISSPSKFSNTVRRILFWNTAVL